MIFFFDEFHVPMVSLVLELLVNYDSSQVESGIIEKSNVNKFCWEIVHSVREIQLSTSSSEHKSSKEKNDNVRRMAIYSLFLNLFDPWKWNAEWC